MLAKSKIVHPEIADSLQRTARENGSSRLTSAAEKACLQSQSDKSHVLPSKGVGKIVGVGRALGGRIVTNHDLAQKMDTDDAWIVTRTGIRERRFVGEGEDCVTVATEASREALRCSGLSGDRIDLVICATTTAPESSASAACLVSGAV